MSYLDPYTITTSDEPQQLDHSPTGFDDNYDIEDDPDGDASSLDAEPLTASDDTLREKFLDSICELLAHTKGGKYVTAAALREKEDSVEIDIVRNDGFSANDENYLSQLTKFLAIQGDDRSRPDSAEFCRSFLGDTIDYSESRVDYCIQDAAKVVKGMSYRPPDFHPREQQAPQLNCLLGCCSQKHAPCSNSATNLLLDLLNFEIWQPAIVKPTGMKDRRREIVERAATAIGSPEGTLQDLSRTVPSADPFLTLKKWRMLARPISNLRTICQIAQLLPNFRSINFILLPPPAPVTLCSNQVPSLQKAWEQLNISESPSKEIPGVLIKRRNRFKNECLRMLPSHSEMQLLMRYEAEPSLAPTLSYFGCSKKACYLCSIFLSISPLKPKVRGRHGMCHPLWAVQPYSWEVMRLRLNELREMLKQQIRNLISSESRSPKVHVKQSSARSELKSADMIELRRQTLNRERLDRDNMELRQRMQIL
ncbi:hypothetical protein BKA56DRAFT_592733 [Ilyonectria sp. MPI-CAGE-AT-0026]|nr:hypothetical protein BKA56DRAFT_592733 [Ilyonectria sp. MPI-CAGE-AT-0026]